MGFSGSSLHARRERMFGVDEGEAGLATLLIAAGSQGEIVQVCSHLASLHPQVHINFLQMSRNDQNL